MPSSLSVRGRALLDGDSMPEYLSEHFTRLSSTYDRQPGPDGYICLAVAENLLLGDRLLDRLSACQEVPETVLAYDSMVGSVDFRRQLSRFFARTFLGREFPPENLAILAGAGSVLEILFHNLADPGDAVLVPTPSYAGFWLDLETRNELSIHTVHTSSDEGFRLTPDHLDRALASSERPVKVLLFTSPNNPLGTVYSREQIEEIVDWARRAEIHVVFDEIYALSVFGDREFTSVAQVISELGDWVHIVWAFSKDFGASGLRCGALVSENVELLRAMDALAYWACCSGHTQYLLGEVVSDDEWLDTYLAMNRAVLHDTYDRITAMLDEAGVPYVPAEAGFFVLCDLRSWLDEPNWDAERALWRKLLDETQVNLTPGHACRINEPGFMRLCFAGVRTETAVEGVRRVVAMLGDL